MLTVGRFHPSPRSPTVFLENAMSRSPNVAIPAALLFSALVLSACATKPKEIPVAASAPVVVAAEKPSAPEAAPEPAPAPVVIAEQPAVSAAPAPKQVVPKAKKKVAKAKSTPSKAVPPPPVAAPAPIVEHAAPAVLPPEPSPPVTIAPPAKKMAEAGFLEQYWLWLLGLVIVIAIAGMVVWGRKNHGDKPYGKRFRRS
jgi:hypothetical protein